MEASGQAFPPGFAQENHDRSIYSVAISLSAVSTLTLALRIYSKLTKQRRLEIDDYLLIMSYVLAIGECILLAVAVKHGLGRHTATLPPSDLIFYGKALLSVATVHNITLALAKESILILFYRIFITRKFRITVWVLAVVVASWAIGCVIAELTICIPVRAHWDTSIIGHCGNQYVFLLATPIPWIVTDFAILIAPLPVLKTLQLPRGRKIGVFALFLIGSVYASCIRVFGRTVFWSLDDPTYDSANTAIWNAIEAQTSVIIVCLIVSRPALLLLYPSSLIASTRTLLRGSKSSEDSDLETQGKTRKVPSTDTETSIYKAESNRDERTRRDEMEWEKVEHLKD